MTQADRVHSTPPINTPIADDPVHAATETYRPAFPPRAPTPQERGDELLMQWRLARAAGIPATNRLDREGPAMPLIEISQEAQIALAELSKRKARERLHRDGASSIPAMQRRIKALAPKGLSRQPKLLS
jgi:hypothetical protein